MKITADDVQYILSTSLAIQEAPESEEDNSDTITQDLKEVGGKKASLFNLWRN